MDDLVVIPAHLGSGMGWAMCPEVSQFMNGAALDLGQPLVSIGDHIGGGRKTSAVEILQEASPACSGLTCRQLKGQEALVPLGAHPQHRKHRHRDHPSGKPHLQMEGVEKDDRVVLTGQVPTRPLLESRLGGKPLDDAGDGAY